jgi:transcriptional regulator with XRE-family HTH domain
MELIRYVGERIKELRARYGSEGISQEALASALGITANTISRWETGTYKPSLDDLDKLSRFFGISMLAFFPPEKNAPTNEPVAALLRATRDLPKEDVEEIRKYAEFRRARAMYEGGKKPRPGRPKVTKD